MYFTYVVRPGELPLGRSPQCRPFWDGFMSQNLRLGTLAQLASFVIIIAAGILSGNGIGYKGITMSGVFGSSCLSGLAVVGSILAMAGAARINGFRNIGDDEGSIKYTRGYRCGVKCLSVASLLDVAQAGMTCIYFLSWIFYYDDVWQVARTGSNPMLTYAAFARFLHFASLVMYAGAFFYMEAYHNRGTAEIWGWSIAFLYIVTAMAFLASIAFGSRFFDIFATATYGVGLFSVFAWAQSFEPIINQHEVELDQSALRNEWFKSKNAMAYYGPPIEEGTELNKQ